MIRLSCLCALLLVAAGAIAAPPQPNVIFILVDDLRADVLGCTGHPFVRTPNIDRIRNEGALFRNAFVTTSLCSPSRASFLTGMYAHAAGVTRNEVKVSDPDFERTPSFAQLLQKAGYETGYVGKWHIAPRPDPRPGFDYWLSFRGQGVYFDPELNENGRTFKASGYLTEILNDKAIEFLQRERSKPFCLYLSHKAVHDPRTVRPADANLYANEKLPQPPNFNDDLRGKPRWLRRHVLARGGDAPPPAEIPDAVPPRRFNPKDKNRLDYLRLLTSIDEGVGRILLVLEKQGQLDNTIIIFAGDNGYFFGEHQSGDKRLMYEESIRIPLLMRYPPLIKPQTAIEPMVLNIDVAPTLLDLCGAPPASHMQGRSVRPLLDGRGDGWRKSFLYSYWIDLKPTMPDIVGVRTEDWKLARYPGIDDIDELYDLRNDPHEMNNLALDPKHAEKLAELLAELDRLIRETGWTRSAPAGQVN